MSYDPNQPGGYGAPQGGYGAPPSGYGAPPGGYGAPQFPYAGMGKRLLAAIIDALIVGLGAIPGVILVVIATAGAVSTADQRGRISNEAQGAFVGAVMLGYLVIFVGELLIWIYMVYLLGRDGATLGKRIVKVKVLEPINQPLGFGKAFLRELVKHLLGGLCFLLYLWPVFDKEKQGLWDKLFNTHVYEA